MYDALIIARYVINYSNKKHFGISNLKLQELLYFIQVFFLMKYNHKCFKKEILAWDSSPIIPEVYSIYKNFANCNISYIDEYDDYNGLIITSKKFDDRIIESQDKKRINKVIKMFKDWSSVDLFKLIHNQDPWLNAHKAGKNAVITCKSIREYFSI